MDAEFYVKILTEKFNEMRSIGGEKIGSYNLIMILSIKEVRSGIFEKA